MNKKDDEISISERSITSHDDEYYNDEILQGSILQFLSYDKIIVIRPHDGIKFIGIPANKYDIFDDSNKKIGYMKEQSSRFDRYAWAQARPFTVNVYDNHDQLLLKITRSRTLLKSNVRIYYNHPLRGMIYIGRSKYSGEIMKRHYELSTTTNEDEDDENDHLFAKIPIKKKTDTKDDVYSLIGFDEHNLATIKRIWNNWKQEILTTKNVYELDFKNIAKLQKIIMIGTTISIDFDFFSNSG